MKKLQKKMPMRPSRFTSAYITDTKIRRNELGLMWNLKTGPEGFSGTVESNEGGVVLAMQGSGCTDGREAAHRIAYYNEHIVRAYCADGHVDSIRAKAAAAGKCDRVTIESPDRPEVNRVKCARYKKLTRWP